MSVCIIYDILENSDDGSQQTFIMLDTVLQYWISMLNPIVTILTVKTYRLRVSALFSFVNKVEPIIAYAKSVGGNALIRRSLRATPVELLQTSVQPQQGNDH